MENRLTYTNKQKALAILRWTIKKYRPFAIAYVILLFLAFPFIEIVNYIVSTGTAVRDLRELMPYLLATAFTAVAILYSSVIAIMAFSYLHNKRCVDFFGGLPVSRRTLFFSRYFAVLALSIIPMLIVGTLGAIISLSDASMLIVVKILAMLTISIIGNVSIIAFISTCCGTIADVIISYLIINGVYPICICVCHLFPEHVLPGMRSSSLYASTYTLLSPIAAPFTAIAAYEKKFASIWWIALTMLVMIGSYVLIKKRKAETAQNAFAFAAVEIIIKFVTCFTVGFGFGWVLSYIGASYNTSYPQYIWFVVGTVIGIMISNFLLHLIFHRGVSKYKKSLIGCGVVFVVAMAFMISVASGGLGYVNNVPNESDVESVSVKSGGNSTFWIKDRDVLEKYSSNKEAIKTVVKIHKTIVDDINKSKYGPLFGIGSRITKYSELTNKQEKELEKELEDDKLAEYSNRGIRIVYKLKNGKTVERQYDLKDNRLLSVKNELKKLEKYDVYTSPKSILNNIPVKYIEECTIKNTISGNTEWVDFSLNGKNQLNLKKIGKIVEAIKKDLKENPQYDINTNKGKDGYHVMLHYYNDRITDNSNSLFGNGYYEDYFTTIDMYIPKEFTNTVMAIKDAGYDKVGYLNCKYYADEYYENIYEDEDDINNSDVTGNTIYFKAPSDWKGKEIYCQLYDRNNSVSFTKFGGEHAKCTKVSENIWKYTLPQIKNIDEISGISFDEIQFYEKDSQDFYRTEFINLDGGNDMITCTLKSSNIKDKDAYNYEYSAKYDIKWSTYKK